MSAIPALHSLNRGLLSQVHATAHGYTHEAGTASSSGCSIHLASVAEVISKSYQSPRLPGQHSVALILMGSVSQLDSHHSGAERLSGKLEQGLPASTCPLVPSSADRSANSHLVTEFSLVSFSANSTVRGDWIQLCARQIIAQSMWGQVTDITQESAHALHI